MSAWLMRPLLWVLTLPYSTPELREAAVSLLQQIEAAELLHWLPLVRQNGCTSVPVVATDTADEHVHPESDLAYT
jgi:hypothetical protein